MPQIEQRWLFGPRRSAADSGADSADRCTSFWDGRSGWFTVGRSSSELSSISDILGGNSIGNEEGHALLPPAYVLGSLPRGAPFAVDYKATALWQVQEGAKLMLCCGNYRSPIRMFLDHVAVALRQHSM
eukprot:gene4936-24834_t